MKTIDELWVLIGTKELDELESADIVRILEEAGEILERQRRVSKLSFSEMEKTLRWREGIKKLPDKLTEELLERERVLGEERRTLEAETNQQTGKAFFRIDLELALIEEIIEKRGATARVATDVRAMADVLNR